MIQDEPQFLAVGKGAARRRIAFRRRWPARDGLPGVVWLAGFGSDMVSTKASALDAHCAERGQAFLRFDYSGHGVSEGEFEDGTVSRWLEDALAAIRAETEGRIVLAGSSMGGLYRAAGRARARRDRRSGEARRHGSRRAGDRLHRGADVGEGERGRAPRGDGTGVWRRPPQYSDDAYLFTRALIEDGRNHLLFGGRSVPLSDRVLQGMLDPDVPYRHALTLIERMAGDRSPSP